MVRSDFGKCNELTIYKLKLFIKFFDQIKGEFKYYKV